MLKRLILVGDWQLNIAYSIIELELFIAKFYIAKRKSSDENKN